MPERVEPKTATNEKTDIPEEVLQKGLQATLRYLHNAYQLRPVPLRKHLPSVASGKTQDALSELSVRSATSVEANAIAAHLIADIWPAMHRWVENHPGVAARRGVHGSGTIEAMPEDTIRQRFESSSQSGFVTLHNGTMSVCSHFVESEFSARSNRADPVLKRLRVLIGAPGYEGYHNNPAQMVLAGFVTANDTIWALLNSIQSTYAQHFGAERSITKAEYKELAASAKQLALALATTQIGMFATMRDELEGESYMEFTSKLQMQGLRIVEDKGSLKLDLQPEKLKSIAERVDKRTEPYRSDVRTGCPALFVSGVEGSSVISDYFDWCYSLAEKYYLPTLEK